MRAFFLCSLLLCIALMGSGCSKYYLSVQQQWIDANYLASVQINTPDPRKASPPLGQMLIIDWYIPDRILKQNPSETIIITLKIDDWRRIRKSNRAQKPSPPSAPK